MSSPCTFGDGALASERLAILAHRLAPYTDALFDTLDLTGTRSVADLGCGPGHTTRHLARRFPGARVVGLERSPAYLAEARARAAGIDGIEYIGADVSRRFTSIRFDIVYARFLVAHLPERRSATRCPAAFARVSA